MKIVNLNLISIGHFMDVKSMGGYKLLPLSKISLCCSLELKFGTNVPSNLRFLNVVKNIHKLPKIADVSTFLSENYHNLGKSTFCIFSVKNISRKHFRKRVFDSSRFLVCLIKSEEKVRREMHFYDLVKMFYLSKFFNN